MNDLPASPRTLARIGRLATRPRGVIGQSVDLVPPPNATLAQAVAPFLVWLRDARGRRDLTIDSYAFDLRSFLAFCAPRGLLYADDVTHRDIEAYVVEIQRGRGLKAASASRHLSCLKTFWTYLVRETVATRNPAAVSFGPKLPPRKTPQYIPPPDHEKVLTTLAADTSLPGRRDFALCATFLLSGLRNGELGHVRLQDVDLTAGHLYVSDGKGGRDRFVTIPRQLTEILTEYLAETRPALAGRRTGSLRRRGGIWHMQYLQAPGRRVSQSTGTSDRGKALTMLARVAPKPVVGPWLFVNGHYKNGRRYQNAGKPMPPRTIYHLVRRKVVPIVGRHVWPHLLRHSYASRLRINGAPLELIRDQLGHANFNTTLLYANIPTNQRHTEISKYLG